MNRLEAAQTRPPRSTRGDLADQTRNAEELRANRGGVRAFAQFIFV